ncbi:hypothetical protein ACLK1T_15125 [Escherichia coli]
MFSPQLEPYGVRQTNIKFRALRSLTNGPHGCQLLKLLTRSKPVWGANPVSLQLAIGAQEHFTGVVDPCENVSYQWNDADQGVTFEYEDIPADMVELGVNGTRT